MEWNSGPQCRRIKNSETSSVIFLSVQQVVDPNNLLECLEISKACSLNCLVTWHQPCYLWRAHKIKVVFMYAIIPNDGQFSSLTYRVRNLNKQCSTLSEIIVHKKIWNSFLKTIKGHFNTFLLIWCCRCIQSTRTKYISVAW